MKSDAAYLCRSAVFAKEAAYRHSCVFKGFMAEDDTIYQANEAITADKDSVLTV